MNDKDIDRLLANAIVSTAPEPDDLFEVAMARLRELDKVVPMKPRAGDRAGAEETIRRGLESVDEIFGDGLVRGRYEVIERIGAGTSGEVYRARDHRLLRDVALKVLRFSSFEDLLRIEREAVGLAKLSHPNVVHVYDSNVIDDASHHYFIVMEFVSGVRLDEWQGTAPVPVSVAPSIRRQPLVSYRGRAGSSAPAPVSVAPPIRRPALTRTLDEILDKYLQVARGLHAIHAQGLVHRDFKPSNVMLASDGSVRIVDFGLASPASESTIGGDGVDPGTMQSVDVVPNRVKGRKPEGHDSIGASTTPDELGANRFEGTVLYAAPEQFLGHPVDARADQFSFFVSLFEALFGQRPFSGNTFTAVAERVTEGKIEWSSAKRPIPLWLHTMIARGLSTRPGDRYPSFTPIIERLEAVGRSHRRRGWLPLTALVAGSSVAAAFWLGGAARPNCDTPPLEMREAWSDSTRGKLHERLAEATDSATADWVTGGLDDYVERWNTQYQVACIRSSGVEPTAPPQESSPQAMRRCLSTQLGEFTAFTRLLSERLVESEHAYLDAREVWRLPLQDPTLCSNHRIATELLGDDASRNREVEELLRQSRVQHFLGNYDAGLRVVDLAHQEAASGKHPGLLAESLIQRAISRAALGRGDDAREDLLAAYKVASGARLPFLELEAMHELVLSESTRGTITAREELFSELLPTEVELLGLSGTEIEARVLNALGAFEYARGHYQRAFEYHERASRIFGTKMGAHDYRAAVADLNAANMLSLLQQHERAVALARDALNRSMQTLGERHPWMAEASIDVGNIEERAERHDLAVIDYRRAKTLFHEQEGALARRGEVEATIELALALLGGKDKAAAIEALDEAGLLLHDALPAPALEERICRVAVGVLYNSEQWERLRDVARCDRRLLEQRSETQSGAFVNAVRAEIKALAELGDICEALTLLELHASAMERAQPGVTEKFRKKYTQGFADCRTKRGRTGRP